MANYKWQETKIYKSLAERRKNDLYAEEIITLLTNPLVMKKIETILNKASTTPKNFTLHDADHSYRVAERMMELIPNETMKVITSYELGFLLLSAYLHDIGMSPTFEKVKSHEEYLTTNKKVTLSDSEIAEFQKWIDNDYKTNTTDISKEKVTDPQKSDYILSYYIRHKHNDWSGIWIEENLKDIQLDKYPHWCIDLIKLCKSHHYGIDKLLSDDFIPHAIGSDSHVHLRYLTMCLRVADVMENDPERTPDVIFNHRSIDGLSIRYWEKDKYFSLIRDANKYTIQSFPDRAYIHKAVLETAQWIENELRLCDELQKLKPLNYSLSLSLNNYVWNIDPTITKEIKPKDDAYEYIDGAFKPNTGKILELLGGNNLYGNSIWAFREIIQNSFDAVKERIAYEILLKNKDPQKLLKSLGDLYSIKITLEKRLDGYWLICKDDGVGMTKSIIEKFFLISGNSKRHEILDLERRCKEKGFIFSRTGQFGIGVLSYFMIADKLIVNTKREQNTGYLDEESMSWLFEIDGTNDFGELKKVKSNYTGTIIELKLKKEIENNIDTWDNKFYDFFKDSITYSPCSIEYNSQTNQLQINHSWTNSENDIKNKIKDQLLDKISVERELKKELLTSKERNDLISKNDLVLEISKEIESKIEFITDEGIIDKVGKYRIHIPYFKLERGNSFIYLKEETSNKELYVIRIKEGYFWVPEFQYLRFSLKGINIPENIRYSSHSNVLIEFDFEIIAENCLSVSRHNISLDENFDIHLNFLYNKIKMLIEKNKQKFNNDYASLNYQYIEQSNDSFLWLLRIQNSNKLQLLDIQCPICDFNLHNNKPFKYREQKLENLFKIKPYKAPIVGKRNLDFLSCFKSNNYSLGINEDYSYLEFANPSTPVLINFEKSKDIFNCIDLPSDWNKNIIFYLNNTYTVSNDYIYINKNSDFFILYDKSIFSKYSDQFVLGIDNFIEKKDCFNYLLFLIINYYDSWIALCEKNRRLIQHLFNKLQTDELYIIDCDLSIITISSNKPYRMVSQDEDEKNIIRSVNPEYLFSKED